MRKWLWTGVTALTILFGGLAIMPAASAQAEQCPDTPTPIFTGGATGTFTQDGVTITWDGSTVTITGGSVTFCIKGGVSGTTGIITKAPGTYSTLDLGLEGPNGQAQAVSNIKIYAVTTTTTPPPPPPTTSTPPPTTSTPPATTTTPPATTTTTPAPAGGGGGGGGGGGDNDSPPKANQPGSSSQLAFTGPSDWVPWAGGLALLLLLLGGLALLRARTVDGK